MFFVATSIGVLGILSVIGARRVSSSASERYEFSYQDTILGGIGIMSSGFGRSDVSFFLISSK